MSFFRPALRMLAALFVAVVVGVPSSANAQTTFPWQGPYAFDLSEDDVDDIVDLLFSYQYPDADPHTDVPVANRKYAKMQLTGVFECWKFEGLCDQFGQVGAAQFFAEYVALVKKLPTKVEYEAALNTMIADYEVAAETLAPYEMSPAEWQTFEASVTAFFGPGGTSFSEPTNREEVTLSDGRRIWVRTGRARYLVAGHSWASTTAYNPNGSNKTNLTIAATFRLHVPDPIFGGVQLFDESPSPKSKFASKVVVTGMVRSFIQNASEQAMTLENFATGTGFGHTLQAFWDGLTT